MVYDAILPAQVMHVQIKDEDVEEILTQEIAVKEEILTQEIVVKEEISEVKVEDWRVAETEVGLCAVRCFVLFC